MEHFEKWCNKIGQYEFSTYLTKEQSKMVWVAALKWTCSNEFDIDAILYELRKG